MDWVAWVMGVLLLSAPAIAETALRARYAVRDLKALSEYEKRLNRLLRRVGLDPYSTRRMDDAAALRRRKEPPVWNRPVEEVDRKGGIDSLVRGSGDGFDSP